MKSAQSIVEYILLSVLMVIIAATVIGAFNMTNFSSNAVFGVKVKGNGIVVPPMTP